MRSVSEALAWAAPAQPAFSLGALTPVAAPQVLLRRERAGHVGESRWSFKHRAPRGLGYALAAALILAAGAIGALRGGQYQSFIVSQGSLGDFLARHLGFDVKVVTISGIGRLGEHEILDIAGVTPNSSIPFFDVDAAKAKLEKTPLVASASVRKLYPNRLVVEIVERAPVALWQRAGEVSIVAADGAALDELKDARLNDLPFVVGKGANKRLKEYLALLDAAQELRAKIEAGVFISERRWNLHMKTGVDVKLPEDDPASVMPALLKLEREHRILERDILSLDLRQPGRAFAKLSAAAADARAQQLAALKPKKGERH